jgi:hypothetical protein
MKSGLTARLERANDCRGAPRAYTPSAECDNAARSTAQSRAVEIIFNQEFNTSNLAVWLDHFCRIVALHGQSSSTSLFYAARGGVPNELSKLLY